MSGSTTEKKTHGVTAEFYDVDSLMRACETFRDAGYKNIDAYTPFPVHGIDKALGIKPTILPWLSLGAGLTGTCIGLAMQLWMNAVDYKYLISGKPFESIPAFIPVSFELTILLASFAAFFGMLILNGLPKFSNAIFANPRFDKATDNTFFLFVGSEDDKYDEAGVKTALGDAGGKEVSLVQDDETSTELPKFLFPILGVVAVSGLIPVMLVLQMRFSTSGKPRFHIFHDMDYSPAKDAQQGTTVFADARAMRPDVLGTVARGQMVDMDFNTGIQVEELAKTDPTRVQRLVTLVQSGEKDPSAGEGTDEPDDDKTPWVTENPLPADMTTLKKGQSLFNIYCSVCHGQNGQGNGLVNQRAQSLLQPTWVQPSSIIQPQYHGKEYPDGKLYN
ncbi:MAG: quinol:electron acceptor oxidoreductase subunit ActD, partial [Planctomycetota bacterium]